MNFKRLYKTRDTKVLLPVPPTDECLGYYLTLSEMSLSVIPPMGSLKRNLRVQVPLSVGVPATVPVELSRVRPEGKFPETKDQL